MNIKQNLKDVKEFNKEVFEYIVLEQKWILMPLAFIGFLVFTFTFGFLFSFLLLVDEDDKEHREELDRIFEDIHRERKALK